MATQTQLNINLLIKFSIWHILSLYVQNFKKHIIFPGVRSTGSQEVTEDCRHCEEEGIDSVEYAAVTRNNVAGIFYLERSFQQRFHKVPPSAEDSHRYRETYSEPATVAHHAEPEKVHTEPPEQPRRNYIEEKSPEKSFP